MFSAAVRSRLGRVAAPLSRDASANTVDAQSPERPKWVVYSLMLAHPLAINTISFFILSLLAFRQNSHYLFHGLDGRFEVSLLTQSALFVPPILGLTNDFIHGLGNVWFPLNAALIPAYVLAQGEPGQFTNFALAYAICATELFLATYVAGRAAGCSRTIALAAGWILALLVFQYVGWNKIPSTFRAFPHYATMAAVSTLVAAAILHIGSASGRKAAILATLCFLGVTYIVLAAPAVLILPAPQLAVFGIVSLFSASSRRDVFLKLAILAAVPLAGLALGYFHFVAGLVFYTAADVFKGLSIRPAGLNEVSMLFWSPIWPLSVQNVFTVERTFTASGILGALWAVYCSPSTMRMTAIAFLSVVFVYIAIGILHVHYDFWFGPALWYFEGFLFPYHAIFAAFLAFEIFGFVIRLLALLLRSDRYDFWTLSRDGLCWTLLIAFVPWAYVRHEQQIADPPNLPYFAPYPQSATPITTILKSEGALTPGGPFRGRVATMTGRTFPTSTNVDVVGLWGIPSVLSMRATGNSHDAAGLWQDSIPTLLEYNPLMTPPYFAFARTFFTEPADLQIRNLVAMRRIEPRLLAAIGVRFVITDMPSDGLRLRQKIDVPVTQDELNELGVRTKIPSFSLYLYEVSGSNIGQYSPTRVRVVRNASDMLESLAEPTLDPANTLIVDKDIHVRLVPAILREFLVERGQFRVRADSSDRSVLLLPMEFSRCLRVANRGSGASPVKLFRADLLLTGVLFEKTLDAVIDYRTGPLGGARCRLDDAKDMAALAIKDAFKRHLDLVPERMNIN